MRRALDFAGWSARAMKEHGKVAREKRDKIICQKQSDKQRAKGREVDERVAISLELCREKRADGEERRTTYRNVNIDIGISIDID